MKRPSAFLRIPKPDIALFGDKVLIGGKVFDPRTGRVVKVIPNRPANTFTLNWIKWLYVCFTQTGSLAGVVDTANGANTVTVSQTPLRMEAGAGTTTYGMLIGTQAPYSRTDISFSSTGNTISSVAGNFTTAGFFVGEKFTVSGSASNNGTFTAATVGTTTMTTTEALVTEGAGATDVLTPIMSLTDYKLGRQATTNVTHGAMVWSFNSPDSTQYQVIGQRTFTNATGSTLNITEVALYSYYAGTSKYYCLDRTLIPINVNNGLAATLYYTWTTHT
jgi:hypothetical protein